jgi:hypothetical protein
MRANKLDKTTNQYAGKRSGFASVEYEAGVSTCVTGNESEAIQSELLRYCGVARSGALEVHNIWEGEGATLTSVHYKRTW